MYGNIRDLKWILLFFFDFLKWQKNWFWDIDCKSIMQVNSPKQGWVLLLVDNMILWHNNWLCTCAGERDQCSSDRVWNVTLNWLPVDMELDYQRMSRHGTRSLQPPCIRRRILTKMCRVIHSFIGLVVLRTVSHHHNRISW